MPDPFKDPDISPTDAYNARMELDRELTVRRRVYPNWARERRNGLTPELSKSRIKAMEQARSICECYWRAKTSDATTSDAPDLFGEIPDDSPRNGFGSQ